jgi:hypothetical protein
MEGPKMWRGRSDRGTREVADRVGGLVIINYQVKLVAPLEQRLFMFGRYDQAFFKLLRRHIFLQCHRFDTDDGLSVDMAMIKLISRTHIDQQYIVSSKVF